METFALTYYIGIFRDPIDLNFGPIPFRYVCGGRALPYRFRATKSGDSINTVTDRERCELVSRDLSFPNFGVGRYSLVTFRPDGRVL